ncbi:Protein CBR-MKS-5 [Caenorhabditis briggsae]|uniref:Protein CBR-MKS-5 n=1 Tax=Caenorhabditis briggsae TaxID=6238 RepID=A8WSZ0_CAEBR|nr:Protein CBR-MKS-5 [Caenorhabditis briggsae]CAP23600.2 Protein CBR-MKS-5 [Caenorhabditis briggsae]
MVFPRCTLILFLPVLLMAQTDFHVNHCVLRCKDNHMREMDNEWSHDFTLPLLNLLKTTGNETAAYIKAHAICTYVCLFSLSKWLCHISEKSLMGFRTAHQMICNSFYRSNRLLEACVRNCNTSQEASIILAGIRSWHDACNNLEGKISKFIVSNLNMKIPEVRAQFPCWKENGERLSSVCRDQTIRLEMDMLKFAKNQTQENIETICIDFEHFSHCFIQEHGKYCGYRSEVITARMFENNREAMFKMLKIRWNTLPTSCKYTQLRRDTYSSDRYNENSGVSVAISIGFLLLPFVLVSARYPIETWSRPQLEDRFHGIVAELQTAQKKIKDQEKQITTYKFNSRFRRSMLERKSREEEVVERSKYDDVVKENKILDMKLKAAKHQLLIYTAPSARAATASMMTGRSTFRQPPSTFRQRQPMTAGTVPRSIDRSPGSVPVIRKKSDADKLQLATDEKLTIVRLNRTMKNKNEEIEELKYTIEKLRQVFKYFFIHCCISILLQRLANNSNNSDPPTRRSSSSKSSSSNNNNDDDEKDSELEEMSEMSESARSTPVMEEKKPKKESNGNNVHSSNAHSSYQPPKIPDQNEKQLLEKLKVAENDLAMIQEECELLKKANERLVQQVWSKRKFRGEKKIVELEEHLKETEKRIKESEHRRREDQKKFEAMRMHYKTKYENMKAEKKQMSMNSASAVKENEEDIDRSDSPPPLIYEPVRKRQSQSDISRSRRADDDLLQKLYNEVADILHSHDVGIAEMSALGAGENSLSRWQKLYSELYEELEKVRNMLVVQYDINQKQTTEIKLLKEELERLKTVSAEILTKSKEEMEQKQKKIFMLEEQIRVIAYSGQQPVKLLSNQINIPTPKVNTNLFVKLIHVKPAASLTSKFFFSMEFFDFQLETSPILDPKEQNIEFTTVYDVLVSNLLIHYLQTNGVVIEMYRPASDCYKLLAAATISLIPLFEDNVVRKFCSEIVMKSVDSGVDMCTLRYEIEVSQPISESFKKFKKSETARNMMPIKLESNEEDENNFEPLTIMVNRLVGLDSLGKDGSSEFCIVYEFLSFSPYFTDFSTSPEIRSKRDCFIPKNDIARNLFASSSISFFLIENIPKQDGVIATLHLPLHPLCKLGGSIKGTFPMLDTDGRPSSVYLDLCLIWKHEIPSFFLKPEPGKLVENTPVKDTPILPQPVRRSSKQFDVTPVADDEPILREEIPDPPAPSVAQILSNRKDSTSSTDTSFSSNSKDMFSPPVAKITPQVFDYELPSSDPPPLAPALEHEEEDRIVFEDDDEIESVSAVSSHRDSEPPLFPDDPTPPPPMEEVPEIQPETTKEEKELTPRAESLEIPKDITPRMENVPPLVGNDQEPQVHESVESTPITQRSVEEVVGEPEQKEREPDEIPRRELKTEELKSLLGVLPPIAKPRNIPVGPLSLNDPPAAPSRSINPTGRIVFGDPLHYSFPPSDSSSTSSPRQKAPVPLPEYEGPSLVKVRKPLSPTDKDVLEPEMKVSIQLESFELLPGSSLIPWTREDTKCFVDWVFLDFPNEQSKSSVFNFPRRSQESVELDFVKEYTLTRGQLSLLDQWIKNSIKFELTLVKVSPGDEEELGFGSIFLGSNNSQTKSIAIELYDRNTSPQAELTVTVEFSRALLQQLNR